MRNVFNLIASILIVLTSLEAFAEGPHRYVDGKVQFLKPAQSESFLTPGRIDIQFSYLNQGPDTIYPTDTLRYELAYAGDIGRRITKKLPVGRIIGINDSIIITESVVIDKPENIEKFYISFRKPPRAYGSEFFNYGRLWSETSETLEDNDPILIVKLTHNVGIDENLNGISLLRSENPTTQHRFEFTGHISKSEIMCFDVLGRTSEFDLHYDQNINVSTVSLPNNAKGIYFINLRRKEKVYSFKGLLQ